MQKGRLQTGFDYSRLADSYISKEQPSVIDDMAMKIPQNSTGQE